MKQTALKPQSQKVRFLRARCYFNFNTSGGEFMDLEKRVEKLEKEVAALAKYLPQEIKILSDSYHAMRKGIENSRRNKFGKSN